jgi:hypothetical protein
VRHSLRVHDLILVRDDSPIGEGKHAVLRKFKSGTIDVEEVENGFASNDKFLQEIIESYWYFKNLRELHDSLHAQRVEDEMIS